MNAITSTVSLEQAVEIMGKDSIIGPEDIQSTFGFTPENIPDIPFSEKELVKARILGHCLILQVNVISGNSFTLRDIKKSVGDSASDGQPLLYNRVDFLYPANPSIRPGWRLTSPEVISNTAGKDYLEQTKGLIAYLQDKVLNDLDRPESYLAAIDEFESKEEMLQDFLGGVEDSWKWKDVAQQLNELTINQIIRENIAEVIYRLVTVERKNGTRHLSNTYIWTNSIALPTDCSYI